MPKALAYGVMNVKEPLVPYTEAYERVIKSEMRYRFVIDIATLREKKGA